MAVLPSRGFGSLYNQNHNNDDDYQKKEGGYDHSPPHGFQKSSCGKKDVHYICILSHFTILDQDKAPDMNLYKVIE